MNTEHQHVGASVDKIGAESLLTANKALRAELAEAHADLEAANARVQRLGGPLLRASEEREAELVRIKGELEALRRRHFRAINERDALLRSLKLACAEFLEAFSAVEGRLIPPRFAKVLAEADEVLRLCNQLDTQRATTRAGTDSASSGDTPGEVKPT